MCRKKTVNIVLLSNVGSVVDGGKGEKRQKVSEFEEGDANACGPRHRYPPYLLPPHELPSLHPP